MKKGKPLLTAILSSVAAVTVGALIICFALRGDKEAVDGSELLNESAPQIVPYDDEYKEFLKKTDKEMNKPMQVEISNDIPPEGYEYYNVLKNIREIDNYYIEEGTYRCLNDDFDDFARENGFKGKTFIVTNKKNEGGAISFDAKEAGSDACISATCLRFGEKFTFSIPKADR